ncbi:zinc metalloprotease HtpX [candidate division WOR-1 bacterium RIFOXYA12_FULL_43_27]|uniref:Protease HtpX homolog n=1 Tax=candidate division WOR-1 bacterium RIFOXYC2_FULL_46_14 TaxID=1802587 RepID=A0A1F4U6E4_UNCSA|nr:MAG: zinc metalloprotease HtpX [candidate division WOR-1 bacterium RIFOXYA12_FULL_43_27]OGC20616.1 MAG: zinc metalloprotease HtpX [candidate division WOR-1 bacterium RIFOXYB2_FULL_46_45]OGC31647.1 MAG: zinc metalloprotease HtpX [candidate division WOR-1 bacterium RIFOXYA2_FULL_46_56]OGC40457.1 MAG: zinc metalloprotease HtpX [candidate division WOR-1 bacterium RIFOXYC2_FULL_46_14]
MNIYNQIASNKRRTWVFIFGFIVVIAILGYVIGAALDMGYGPLFIAGVIAIVMSIGSYYYSDKLVLAISGAREVKFESNKELYRLVENLCIGAGIPLPKIYIIDDTAPNAFATGRDPKHGVVCITTGLLQKLEKAELEGVIAHELSHIQNYDIRLMTIVSILAGTVLILSDLFLRWSFWGGGRKRDSDSKNGQLEMILFIVAIVLAILAPLIAQIIQLAISRKRELLADASAALLTRYPEGLARALEKLTADTEPLEAANRATAHLYIINPLKEFKGSARGWFSGMFATHPPIEERVAALRAM